MVVSFIGWRNGMTLQKAHYQTYNLYVVHILTVKSQPMFISDPTVPNRDIKTLKHAMRDIFASVSVFVISVFRSLKSARGVVHIVISIFRCLKLGGSYCCLLLCFLIFNLNIL